MNIIDDLFNIEYGQKEYHNKEWLEGCEGKTILISSKGTDNGIYGYFDIKAKYQCPIITIPSTGSIGYAFVQNYPCCVDDNCLVLLPKEKLEIESLYQIVFQLRNNIWKYKYGRQITPERIKKQEIFLCEINKKYNCYKENRQYTYIKEFKELQLTENVKLGNICNIKKRNAPPQNSINLEGNIPYITTTSKNNGISHFTDEEPNFDKNCLTVALNGSVGEVFYQNRDFLTSGDNAVLYLKNEYSDNLSDKEKYFLLLYIGIFIKNEKWKYNYYRKLSQDKLGSIAILVPKINDKIDIKYIENVIYSVILE